MREIWKLGTSSLGTRSDPGFCLEQSSQHLPLSQLQSDGSLRAAAALFGQHGSEVRLTLGEEGSLVSMEQARRSPMVARKVCASRPSAVSAGTPGSLDLQSFTANACACRDLSASRNGKRR